MKELTNKQAGMLLGFIAGIILGEILYFFTDEIIFFIIVLFMTILGAVLGGEVDLKEKN